LREGPINTTKPIEILFSRFREKIKIKGSSDYPPPISGSRTRGACFGDGLRRVLTPKVRREKDQKG